MVNAKPSITVDARTSAALLQGQRRNRTGQRVSRGGESEFASFLSVSQLSGAQSPPPGVNAQAATRPVSVAVTQIAERALEQAAAKAGMPADRNSAAASLGLRKGDLKDALLQRNAPSLRQGGVFDGKEALGANAPPSAGGLDMGFPGSPAAARSGGFSLQQARSRAQSAVQGNGVQAFAARQALSGTRGSVSRSNTRKERISGRPITGRNNIGMVDPRKAATRNTAAGRNASGSELLQSVGGLTVNGQLQSYASFSLQQPGFYFGPAALDIFSGRNAGLQNNIAEADGKASKNGISLGSVRNVRRPGKEEGAETAARTQGHRRRENDEQRTGTEAGHLISGPATRALLDTFYNLSGEIPVGVLAAKFESGPEGIAAIGYDRNGGTSYGKFQFSSRAGTMRGFISYLEDKAPDMAKALKEAGPANSGKRTGKMAEAWKALAAKDPERFESLQNEYIRKSHFEPALRSIEESTGLSVKDMPPALQEVVFSTAVQHGVSGATRIVSRAVDRVGAGKLQENEVAKDAFQQAGRDLIKHIYNLRSGQFASSTAGVRASVKSRLQAEMRDALSLFA